MPFRHWNADEPLLDEAGDPSISGNPQPAATIDGNGPHRAGRNPLSLGIYAAMFLRNADQAVIAAKPDATVTGCLDDGHGSEVLDGCDFPRCQLMEPRLRTDPDVRIVILVDRAHHVAEETCVRRHPFDVYGGVSEPEPAQSLSDRPAPDIASTILKRGEWIQLASRNALSACGTRSRRPPKCRCGGDRHERLP